MADEGGVWRTISGRRVFIKDGQNLTDALRESGKFSETGAKSSSPLSDQEKYGVVVRLKDGTYVQIAQHGDISDLTEGTPFGLRTLPAQGKRKYLVGSQVPNSYDWDHDDDVSTFYTDKRRLNGASALSLLNGDSVEDLKDVGARIKKACEKNSDYGENEDKHRIIVGDSYEYGEDSGEIIIHNPRVWGIVYKYGDEKDVKPLAELGAKTKARPKAVKSSDKKISLATANENLMSYQKQLAQKYDVSLWNVRYRINDDERKKLNELAEIRRKALNT